ncbi:MAG: M28 family peptidase [Candidatus Omnitrophica bacterium]|nr:M28 family peptidase [Candidatus Omnitrophota bacterium]
MGKVRFLLPGLFTLGLNTLGLAMDLESNLKKHIKVLAGDIGERNYIQYKGLERAGSYIKEEFVSYGYQPVEQIYHIKNQPYKNIIATKRGEDKKEKIIIVCAHYDTVLGSSGADDNASGVAVLLELARLLYKEKTFKTIKFIAFTNEEPPLFMTEDMGSFFYAKQAKGKKEAIDGVLCLESLGFYSDKKGSQDYPFGLSPFYPDKGNFIAIVSNFSSHSLLKIIVKEFKKAVAFPLEYLVAPVFFAPAISFSDNYSFWRFGYKAVMITDTAFYRNPYYHTSQDTPEKLNYNYLAKVTEGLYYVLINLGR